MFKAAFSPFSGGTGSGDTGVLNLQGLKISGGIGEIAKQIKERKARIENEDLNPNYDFAQSTGSFEASDNSVDMPTLPVFDGRQPNVPMMPPANSAANTPVFSPVTQEKAASVYGTDNERQGAVSGFRQEAKDRIISELNNL